MRLLTKSDRHDERATLYQYVCQNFRGWLPSLGLLLLVSLLAPTGEARAPERITPLLLAVQDAPVPFIGSDARTHLVYELWVTNFSSGDAVIERVEILGDGMVLATLDSTAVAGRLQPAGLRESSGTMAKSTEALLFLHVALPNGASVPQRLTHRLTARATAAPPGQQTISATGGETMANRQDVVVIGPPLQGERYLSADSCCDATRHTRAALPVNGRIWLAQRFAVDWEQLDDQGRIYAGAREDPASYAIFGKDVLAVADAKVVTVINDLPEQTPGTFPSQIPIEEADGNSIVLDLGGGRYGLYAHLQPGSITVHPGNTVKRGQVIARVGNSGNSIAPHLHFHVMSTPSPLASNGLPYEIDAFRVTGTSPSTAAFDAAEAHGTPLAVTPISPPTQVVKGMPLDQLLIAFQGQ